MFNTRNVSLAIATVIAAVLLVSMSTSLLPAQDANPAPAQPRNGGGGGGGGGGQGGGGRFAEMRQQMADRLKAALGANDDEWKVLQPRIEKVTTLQMQSRMGGFGGRGGGPGGGGGRGGQGGERGGQGGGNNGGNAGGPPGGGDRPQSETAKATEDLRKLLENKDAPEADIKAKLEALRAAKEKAKQEITKAQAELREILTLRQEAELITFGILD